MFTFLRRLGVREAEVEDALHDTFITAMRAADCFDSRRPLKPWLLGIAYRDDEARAAAKAFLAKYPASVFGPAVERVLKEP